MSAAPVRATPSRIGRATLAVAAAGLVSGGLGGGVAVADGPDACVGSGRHHHHCFRDLQAAVDAARDGDTIRIARGTYAGGVVVHRSVRLAGSGAGRTAIRGGGPVLTLGGARVFISDLTISGGVTTTNPRAPACGPDVPACGPGYADATALGGGIEALPGTDVTLLRTVVEGNRARPARSVASVRAICPAGPCPVSFGDAAGIDTWGTMRLIRTVVRDNHASGVQSNGGGIVDEAGASLALDDSRVTHNSAEASAPDGRFVSGGGIHVDALATLTVHDSAIIGNRVRLANSIPRPYPQQGGAPNQANARGGGIFVSDGATATIRDSHLDRNAVTVDAPLGEPFGTAAALCACGGALTLDDADISGNTLSLDVLSTRETGASGPTALEADGTTTIEGTRVIGNAATLTAPKGDAGLLGAVGFLSGGSVPVTVSESAIASNSVAAIAPAGAATVQGAGLTNAGPLELSDVEVRRNRGAATGLSGFAQGGGIWNGALLGLPTASPALDETRVTRNLLTASPGLDVQGGGLFTRGFPPVLTDSEITRNAPDQCVGC